MRIGIVDLGTNSVRFAIYEEGGPQVACLYKEKLMLRPGQGVFETGKLKKSTIKKLVQAFVKFHRRAERMQCHKFNAVATSAMREAKNASEFLRRVQRRTGIRVRVISGKTEAQLIAKGLLAFTPRLVAKSLLVDIGGGSTEFSLVQSHRPRWSKSLPLGAFRLKQTYYDKPFTPNLGQRLARVAELRSHIQEVLSLEFPRRPHLALATGSSGTIRAVGRLLNPTSAKKNPLSRKSLSITRRALRRLASQMLTATKKELRQMRGMEKRRLDLIVPGTLLLLEIFEYFQIDKMQTSSFGLRDGLLAEELQAQKIPFKLEQ